MRILLVALVFSTLLGCTTSSESEDQEKDEYVLVCTLFCFWAKREQSSDEKEVTIKAGTVKIEQDKQAEFKRVSPDEN